MTHQPKKIPYLKKAMSEKSRPKCKTDVLKLFYSFPLRNLKLKHYFTLLIVTQEGAWGQLTLPATDKGIVSETISTYENEMTLHIS